MAPDIVDTIREFVSNLRERTTVPPGPAPRIISRQEWQDIAFPDTEPGYAPGSVGYELDIMGTAINEASRQVASAFGVSMAEVADQVLQMRANDIPGQVGLVMTEWVPLDPNRDERAKELLLSLLDDKQRAMYEEYGCFVSVGSKTGDHYLVYTANSYNVYNISTGHKFCAVAATGVPFCDMLASQLLMIECEEEVFLAVANEGAYWEHKNFFQWLGLPFTLGQKLVADAPKREKPKPEPSVTRAPRIGEPTLYFTDGGPYAIGREVMQGYADGIRDGPYATATTDEWQDCGNPNCVTCREYRREEQGQARPVYHPAFLPPHRDPRSLLSHLNGIRTTEFSRAVGYESAYNGPELHEVMQFFDIPMSLEHDVIRWAEECLP